MRKKSKKQHKAVGSAAAPRTAQASAGLPVTDDAFAAGAEDVTGTVNVTGAPAAAAVPFVRLANSHIYRTETHSASTGTAGLCTAESCTADSLTGFPSLSALGLYALLSALLSNPAFETASGGMLHLLSSHCRNGVFSLSGTMRALRQDGYLVRTRVATAENRFADYYDLAHEKGQALQTDTALPAPVAGSRCLSHKEAGIYRKARKPFSPPTDDFTMVSIPMLMDPRLSLAAKGLYAVIARYLRLAEYRSDIVLSKAFLADILPVGENAFDRLFRELRRTGYLTLTRARDPMTGRGFYRYALCEAGAAAAAATAAATAETATAETAAADAAAAKTAAVRKNSMSAMSGTFKAPPTAKDIRSAAEVRDAVRARIEYDCLCAEYPRERLDAVVSILASFSGDTASPPPLPPGLGSDRATVTARLAALDAEDVRYVLDTYETVSRTSVIRSIRAYLTTCLYHAKENLALALDRVALQTPGLVRNAGGENALS